MATPDCDNKPRVLLLHHVLRFAQLAQFMRRRQLRDPQEHGTGGWSG